jgi:serralysin
MDKVTSNSSTLLADSDPLAGLNLSELLKPVAGAIASANAARTQAFEFEKRPAPPAKTTFDGTVSVQEALGPSFNLQDDDSEGVPVAGKGPSLSAKLPRILGTANNDDITGSPKSEIILGLAGNDTLRGANGDDVVSGGEGNDIISGDHVPGQTTQSDDLLIGWTGDDKLFGRIGDDVLSGGEGSDQLFGGSGRDRLHGGNGNDQLFGGIVEGDLGFNPFPDERDRLVGSGGNDFIDGGLGGDSIDGSDRFLMGRGEVDILTGGADKDFFVLGNSEGAYYTQGGASQDFAVITDFQEGDRIRLYGNASQYVLGYDSTENSTALGYLGNGSFELVGVFTGQNLSGLSLTSSAFVYAS